MKYQENLIALNRLRGRIIAGVAIAILIAAIGLGMFFYKFFSPITPSDLNINPMDEFNRNRAITTVFSIVLMGDLLFAVLYYESFKRLYKEFIVKKPLDESFDNLNYEWANGFSIETIQSFFPYTSHPKDTNYSEDLIQASYKGIPFELSDVMVYFNASGNNKYFMGRMMVIDLPDKLTNSVQIFSKTFTKNYNLPYLPDIEMDSVEFNRNYIVKAANPHDAFYLLTPHMMEHIDKLSKRFEGIAIHAFGNKIAFALRNNNTNSFDPAKWYKKVNYQDELSKVYREIDDIKAIISVINDLGSNSERTAPAQDNLTPGGFRITHKFPSGRKLI